jgi:hypothetical protein
MSGSGTRPLTQEGFGARLFQIQVNKTGFERMLGRVMPVVPDWYIEQGTNGYFVRIQRGAGYHDSEGLGDGITSLFVLVDALYDSAPGDLIAVDEPELSLHPTLQQRLAALISDLSSDRQIILATHSAYFVDPALLANGARVARAFLRPTGSRLSQLSDETGRALSALTIDLNNPHTLGPVAREAFFQDDEILLLEGQEDVQLLTRIQEQVGVTLKSSTFGWGVGGAEKMPLITRMFEELGYEHVAGILDADKSEVQKQLQRDFPKYWFGILPADDIRTKPARTSPGKLGLLDEKYMIRPEMRDATMSLLNSLNGYFS